MTKSKWTLLGGLVLALVILTASPAMADEVTAEAGIEDVSSGDAEGSFAVTNWGNLSNQSAFGWNLLNTGNAVSAVAISQENTETDDIEIEGSSIAFGGELEGESTQVIGS